MSHLELVGSGPADPSQFQLDEGESLIICPYDMSHLVRDERMLIHLIKCRRNHERACEIAGEDVQLMACKFNWTHHIPQPEIQYHEMVCKDRYNVLRQEIDITKPDPKMPRNILKEIDSFEDRGRARELVEEDATDIPEFEEDKPKFIWPQDYKKLRLKVTVPSKPPVVVLPTECAEEEDWAAEAEAKNRPVFDAMEQLDVLQLGKYPPNMTRSERKKWKEENEMRVEELYGTGMLNIEPAKKPEF